MTPKGGDGRPHAQTWPYPLEYDQHTTERFDVLVIGGGIAGCHAAINAARRGARVAVLDKGAVVRSGSGGAGCDHWHAACLNPCSRVTPEDLVEVVAKTPYRATSEYGNDITCYITAMESYDALLDLESMGVKIRDEDNDFEGAAFRDEETKLLFAYDYVGRHCLRVQGWDIKPALHKELKRLGVAIFDRVMGTSLLTRDGKQGAPVVGATAINVRTGRFYTFMAKATILTTARPSRLWNFSTEIQGMAASLLDPNCAGDGCAMAWNAGAELSQMERSAPTSGPFKGIPFGSGECHATWFPCSIVDRNGKPVPWMDKDGRLLESLDERSRPAPGQRFFLSCPAIPDDYKGPSVIADLADRIAKGEFELPLYADLPSMPAEERRAIWGLMIGHEGVTRVPIYQVYGQAGFDPDKDLLQVTAMSPNAYRMGVWWANVPVPELRESGILVDGGGLVFDWNLRTSLEGLYAAGMQLAGGGNHSACSATGRYAGRNAAEYAASAPEPEASAEQVAQEMERAYAPVRRTSGFGWKEVHAGISHVMQDYCGEYRSEGGLVVGLDWLDSIEESEYADIFARNPHELMRTLETGARLAVCKATMHASLARKASSMPLSFKRLDYPEVDPPEWRKHVAIHLENGEVRTRDYACDYPLQAPYSADHSMNYRDHCALR
jgi:succinate dehydrogenase/fumarate reductase flavoprotein subunit